MNEEGLHHAFTVFYYMLLLWEAVIGVLHQPWYQGHTFTVAALLCQLESWVTLALKGSLRIHTAPVGTQAIILTLIDICQVTRKALTILPMQYTTEPFL